MDASIYELPWYMLITLASGYMGYYIANTGLRSHHKQIDITFLTLVYGLIGLLGYKVGFFLGNFIGEAVGYISGTLLAILFTTRVAICWRKAWKNKFKKYFADNNIFYADDLPSAWQALFDVKGYGATQLNVHLKNGEILHCSNMDKFKDEPNGAIYMGENGDLTMYVTHICENGTFIDKDPSHKDWGTLVTYVPASEIAKVTIRRKKITAF